MLGYMVKLFQPKSKFPNLQFLELNPGDPLSSPSYKDPDAVPVDLYLVIDYKTQCGKT